MPTRDDARVRKAPYAQVLHVPRLFPSMKPSGEDNRFADSGGQSAMAAFNDGSAVCCADDGEASAGQVDVSQLHAFQ